jgi:hypothetical protein
MVVVNQGEQIGLEVSGVWHGVHLPSLRLL